MTQHGPHCSPPKDCYCGAIEAASPPSLDAPAEQINSSTTGDEPWPIDAECRYCDSRNMRAFTSPAYGPSYLCGDCGVVSLGKGFTPDGSKPKLTAVQRVMSHGNYQRHDQDAQRDIETLWAEILRLQAALELAVDRFLVHP